jgi:hypothetical protein
MELNVEDVNVPAAIGGTVLERSASEGKPD